MLWKMEGGLVFWDGDELDWWSRQITPISLTPSALQKRWHKRQRESADQISRHQTGFKLVVWVSGELGGVAADLGEGVGGEGHFCGCYRGWGCWLWVEGGKLGWLWLQMLVYTTATEPGLVVWARLHTMVSMCSLVGQMWGPGRLGQSWGRVRLGSVTVVRAGFDVA